MRWRDRSAQPLRRPAEGVGADERVGGEIGHLTAAEGGLEAEDPVVDAADEVHLREATTHGLGECLVVLQRVRPDLLEPPIACDDPELGPPVIRCAPPAISSSTRAVSAKASSRPASQSSMTAPLPAG